MRPSDRATLITIAAIVAGAIAFKSCSPPPPGLPPKVQAAVVRHEVQTVIDTAEVHRLERAAARKQRMVDSATAAARASKSAADREKARADSLLLVAAAAASAADSAEAFRLAEAASRQRADSLDAALVNQAAATAAAEQRADSLEAALSIETTRADRADRVLAQVIPVAEGRACKIARVITCPTRTQAAVGGTLIGLAALAIADGKLRVSRPF